MVKTIYISGHVMKKENLKYGVSARKGGREKKQWKTSGNDAEKLSLWLHVTISDENDWLYRDRRLWNYTITNKLSIVHKKKKKIRLFILIALAHSNSLSLHILFLLIGFHRNLRSPQITD